MTERRQPIEFYLVPSGVVITARIAYLLDKRTNINDARIRARGLDDEFVAVLVALRKLAMSYVESSEQVLSNGSDASYLAEPTRELSSEQAADLLGVSSRAVTKAIGSGLLAAAKVKGCWVIQRSDLEQYRADRKREVREL